ncbi:S-adenosyl-L-methionine-dependent methyltransferase [Rhizoctonia solani]|nr:S-adenosyl-L-methionine-dependent methyltransferase [Rhizoctonia solani]
MQMCLSHPIEGYYMKGEPIGARGDFITSPEISQVFGELVGIWLVSQWLEHGQNRPIQIVELGPGRGTLMDDILRTFESIGQTRGRIQAVHLVETSARLQEEQRHRLGARISENSLRWYDRVEEIPENDNAFTLVVAHEFFDAIPIHIIEKTLEGFQEVLVDIDRTAQTMTTSHPSPLVNTPPPLVNTSSPKPQPSAFRFVLSGRLSPLAHTLGNSSPRFADVPNKSRIEVSPSSWGIARAIGALISGKGRGAGLVVDYGDDRAFGSSFRAFQSHKLVDVFHQPGSCDLTANVDFAYLKEAFRSTPTTTHGPITQHAFLTNMGALIRLHRLVQGAKDDETRERLRKGAARLMDLLGMGGQYKIMGVTSGEKQEQVYPFGP